MQSMVIYFLFFFKEDRMYIYVSMFPYVETWLGDGELVAGYSSYWLFNVSHFIPGYFYPDQTKYRLWSFAFLVAFPANPSTGLREREREFFLTTRWKLPSLFDRIPV